MKVPANTDHHLLIAEIVTQFRLASKQRLLSQFHMQSLRDDSDRALQYNVTLSNKSVVLVSFPLAWRMLGHKLQTLSMLPQKILQATRKSAKSQSDDALDTFEGAKPLHSLKETEWSAKG